MTREEIQQEVLALNSNSILVEAATGVGKSLISMLKIEKAAPDGRILVVIPRKVLIENWKQEFIKWGYGQWLPRVDFVTYISYPNLKGRHWDAIIYDECHHLSERCRKSVPHISSNVNILLSATVSKKLKEAFYGLFKGLKTYKVPLKFAIENDIIPEPRIIVIPLTLDTTIANHVYVVKPRAKDFFTVSYQNWFKNRWKYFKMKLKEGVKIFCTERQYYAELSADVASAKRRFQKNPTGARKSVWLGKCNARLKWLSDTKTKYVKSILEQLSSYRTLTFCNGISHTEELGSCAINSKDTKKSTATLASFNDGTIDHITACNMLDEGVNLSDCQVAIFAHFNASERMQIQKVGRALRHPKPIIILPYYQDTREEEILTEMLEQYDKSLIEIQSDPSSITL